MVPRPGRPAVGEVGRQRRGHQGRLAVRRGLRELVDAAADLLHPSGAREHGGVLVGPPARQRQPRHRVGAPRVVRRHHPHPRPGPVLRPAGRLRAAPGDAALPRQLQVRARRSEREPGPRAARAAHRGPRLGLHRGDGQGLGEDPVRLHRRRLQVLGRLLRREPAHHRSGPGPRLHRPQRIVRRPAARRGLPALPGPPPGHRPHDRHQAVPPPRRRPAPGVTGERGREGLPRLRHRHRRHPAGPGRPPRLRRLARPAGAQPRRGPGRHLPRPAGRRPPTPRRPVVRAGVRVGAADHAALPVAAPGRRPARRRRVVLAHPDAVLVPHALEPDRRLVAHPRRHVPQERRHLAAPVPDPARPVGRPPVPSDPRQAVGRAAAAPTSRPPAA